MDKKPKLQKLTEHDEDVLRHAVGLLKALSKKPGLKHRIRVKLEQIGLVEKSLATSGKVE